MPVREKPTLEEVRTQIDISLREWGVSSANVGRHRSFSTMVREDAEKYVNQTRSKSTDDGGYVMLPRDTIDAIRYVYESEFRESVNPEGDTAGRVPNKYRNDALCKLISFEKERQKVRLNEPYYLRINRFTQEEEAIPKPVFKTFSKRILDPFFRFSGDAEYTVTTKAKHAYETTVGEEYWLQGIACEAIVGCHAIHKEACANCHHRNCLQWSGGAQKSWKDLYCQQCGSCYEIKSKKNMEALAKVYKYGAVHRGGSFGRWCKEGGGPKREGKDYVVFVSRARSLVGSVVGWYVEIAEIEVVMPRIDAKTFEIFLSNKRKKDKLLPIKSTIHIKRNTRSHWFHAPAPKQKLDLIALAKDAFERVFPGGWDEVTGSTETSEPKEKAAPLVEKDVEEELRRELEKL